MAMTDWKPTNSDHTLSNDSVAGQFRYRHYINWEVFLGGTFGIGFKTATGGWKIQIKSPSDEVIFEQETKITMQVVSLGFFGLVLFTWNFVKQDINTTIVAGQEVTEENPAYIHTIGGGVDSEDGAYFTPGGGSDYVDATATITGFWESTIYNSLIPVGSTLHVIYDTWGLGISLRPEYQFSFGAAQLGGIDSTMDTINQMYIAAPSWELNNGIAYSRLWPPYEFKTEFSSLDGDSPSMVVLNTGKVVMTRRTDDGVFLYESLDAMRTWTKNEAVNLAQGIEMPQVIGMKGGSVMAVVKVDATWKYTLLGSDGVYTQGEFTGDGDMITLSQSDDGTVYAINENALVVAASTDGGKTFKAPETS